MVRQDPGRWRRCGHLPSCGPSTAPGRCTDCGACESACPQGINMRRLTSKIEKDIRELYGWEPGMDLEAQPPMSVFRPQ
jgi:ferredoxin